MSRRTVVLLVALLLSAVASFSVWRYLTTVEENVRSDISEVVVYRATETIPEGTSGAEARGAIGPSTDLAVNVAFDESTIVCEGPVNRDVPDVDFTVCEGNPSDLNAVLEGNFSVGLIARGQLITSDMFVPAAEVATDKLSAQIPQGKVAIAISPGNVGSVGGFVQPGDRVNVLATFRLDTSSINELLADPDTRAFLLENADLSGLVGTNDPVVVETPEGVQVVEPPEDPLSRYANALPDAVDFTQTILQNLRVLAVGTQTLADPVALDGERPEGEAVIILEVTPEEAELIEFARQRTQLAVSLLPSDVEYTEVQARGATVDDIFEFLERIREDLEEISGR
jgi:Flp pilus assembly protein CpaB